MAKNPLRGEGVSPTSAKEKFRQEPILALLGPLYGKHFLAVFRLGGKGVPPNSAKLFLPLEHNELRYKSSTPTFDPVTSITNWYRLILTQYH